MALVDVVFAFMKLLLRISSTVLFTMFVATVLALGCEATNQRPPKQAEDAPLASPKYGDQQVILQPPTAASAASSAK